MEFFMVRSLSVTARGSFARILKQKRLQNDLSQEALAHIAGISMRSISLLECNKQQPTITTIETLAEALKTSMTEFIAAVENNKLAQQKFHLRRLNNLT